MELPAQPHIVPLDLQSTAELLARARDGESDALDVVLSRYLPALRRWAHGRVPPASVGLVQTDDLVQDAMTRFLGRYRRFDPQHPGAVLGYLRQIVLNRIRDHARTGARRPRGEELDEQEIETPDLGPFERLLGAERVKRYEEALLRLSEADREAIISRIELQHSYEEVALTLGKPSIAAARMAVVRACYRLSEEINRGG